MIFDAHAERVDEYCQQNAACEITVIDETPQILTADTPLDCKTNRPTHSYNVSA